MIWRVIIPFIICFCLTAASAGVVWGGARSGDGDVYLFPESPYRLLHRLDETATALYKAAYMNQRQKAYAELQKLDKLIRQDNLRAYGAPSGWRMLVKDAEAIDRALSSGVQHALWIEHAVRIRLGTDALINGNRALWLQYEELLQDDLTSVQQAWRRQAGNSKAAAQAMLKGMTDHAMRIESAALFAGDSVRMAELLDRISYSKRLIQEIESAQGGLSSHAAIEQSFEGIRFAFQGVFLLKEAEAVAWPAINPPASAHPIRWAMFLGTMISAMLTWTGWRKYKQSPYGVKKA